jgi:hypothetical protein
MLSLCKITSCLRCRAYNYMNAIDSSSHHVCEHREKYAKIPHAILLYYFLDFDSSCASAIQRKVRNLSTPWRNFVFGHASLYILQQLHEWNSFLKTIKWECDSRGQKNPIWVKQHLHKTSVPPSFVCCGVLILKLNSSEKAETHEEETTFWIGRGWVVIFSKKVNYN